MAKEYVVSAKVPADVEKGIEEKVASVAVTFADTLKEAGEMFGEEAVLSNAFANWRVTLQGNIRSSLRKGETGESLSARLTGAKMGVAQTGGKVDPVEAYIAMYANSTPEKQREMLEQLKKKAS